MKTTISKISMLHYWKMIGRSVLLLAALAIYLLTDDLQDLDDLVRAWDWRTAVLAFIWICFVLEMILRFFPSNFESMGCQKQFRKNYIPTGKPVPDHSEKGMWITLAAWVILNGAIGTLYLTNVIDEGILILISLAYSVCDMICILFFCPFQTWWLKNKCCGSCRIYNWDFAMMFTPLLFLPGFYTWSLLGLAVGLLITWEVLYHKYPERFFEQSNRALACANCQEKLCRHKKQLRSFLRKQRSIQ